MSAMIEKVPMKEWGGRKKPVWRPFNVKLTATIFNKICKLKEDGYTGSITEFIRVALAEKIEKMEQLQQKQQNTNSTKNK